MDRRWVKPKAHGRYRLLVGALSAGLFLTSIGCLEPFDEDESVVGLGFGPPNVALEDTARVDESLGFERGFTTDIRRLSGFSQDVSVAFWRPDGVVVGAITPVWRLEQDGEFIGLPIVDVLPGDQGYSPFWRVHRVPVAVGYQGEKIWSRDAVDLGVSMGILETPIPTETVLVAPITVAGLTYEIEGGSASPSDVWYRNQRAAWVRFPEPVSLSVDIREVPANPAYVLQRIDQPFLLDEDREGFDLDGDGAQVSTHQVFASDWFPLCSIVVARATSTLLSIDGQAAPFPQSTDDILRGGDGSSVLGLVDTGRLELCPWDESQQ